MFCERSGVGVEIFSEMKPVENLPATPDLQGAFGRAWRYDIEAIVRKANNKPHSSIVSWLIEAKNANPMWHSYAMHLIHLRDMPGLGRPKIYLPGATHEIMLFALNPEMARDLQNYPHVLLPINFAAQFIAICDDWAIARINETVFEIVNGGLSPDTDHLQSWIQRFGSAMLKGHPATAGETKITFSQPGKQPTQIIFPPQAPKDPLS